MAYRERRWPSTDLPFFYNLHHNVGQGCHNQRDDVVLVQVLLHKVIPIHARHVYTDGLFSPTTRNAILEFQREFSRISVNNGFQALTVDGVVSSATNIGYHSGGNHRTAFTITALNLEFKKKAPVDFEFLSSLPFTPPELRGRYQ